MAEFYRKKKKICQMCAGKSVEATFILNLFIFNLKSSLTSHKQILPLLVLIAHFVLRSESKPYSSI